MKQLLSTTINIVGECREGVETDKIRKSNHSLFISINTHYQQQVISLRTTWFITLLITCYANYERMIELEQQTELQEIIEQRGPHWPDWLLFNYMDKVQLIRVEPNLCKKVGHIVGYETGTFGVIYIVRMKSDGHEWPFKPSQLQRIATIDKPTKELR